jgi:hypothetical protein
MVGQSAPRLPCPDYAFVPAKRCPQMTWPPVRKWPRLAALVYAVLGSVIFGISTIKPVLDDGSDNFTTSYIMNYSYPCASHYPCPLGIDIPFKTANFLMDYTPLDVFVNDHFENPVIQFWFTKYYSPMSPYDWLFKIIWGCIFYYCLTWLGVRLYQWVRHRQK